MVSLSFSSMTYKFLLPHHAAMCPGLSQLNDILRTFVNETNTTENRFGKIREKENMLAVKKLTPENLWNFRFRGTTVSYEELLVALENIIIDKVSTVPPTRNRKNDTSAPVPPIISHHYRVPCFESPLSLRLLHKSHWCVCWCSVQYVVK